MIQNNVNTIALVARILIGLLFVVAGYGKIGGFDGIVGYIGSKGLPMPQVLAALTIALELGGGLLLMAGYKVRWVAIAFFLWLIPTTFISHKFWGIDAAQVQNQMNHFLKNVSIMGAMLMLVAFGPGAYSVEKK